MIDGFSEAQVIGALIAVLMTSYAAFFGWLVMSINRLDRKIYALDGKLNALTIAVSRLEGAVYHGLPGEPRRADG
jgi:hypothetical protein